MRQKSLSPYPVTIIPTPKKRGRRSRRGSTRSSAGVTITPLRGFGIALICLGIPTVSLGTLCFSLLQNNLQLSEKNDALKEMATEVRADIDHLDREIDSLRERAGVEKDNAQASKASKVSSVHRDASASAFPPKGGPAKEADALVLLAGAKAQVPELNEALASAEPALTETLAAEAAYPDGQPVIGQAKVSSEFGLRGNPFGGGYEIHEGIDFVGEYGDIIAATGDGVVTLAGYHGGYGNSVTVDHGNGYETLYAHMSEVKVNVGEAVKRGQIVGYIGSTGRSSGPHLHYSLYKDKKAINPRKLMKLPENK
ncbi:MAG: M23 family metallopeptidase [Phormidesmis sp.]